MVSGEGRHRESPGSRGARVGQRAAIAWPGQVTHGARVAAPLACDLGGRLDRADRQPVRGPGVLGGRTGAASACGADTARKSLLRRSIRLLLVAVPVALAAGCRDRGSLSSAPAEDLLATPARVELRADRVDIPFLLGQGALEHEGWLERRAEDPGPLWSRQPEAWLELPFASTSAKELSIRARSHRSLGPRLDLVASLNEKPIGSMVLGPEEREYRLRLPASVQTAGRNLLRFEVLGWRDLAVGGPGARRRRWIAFTQLHSQPAGAVLGLDMPRADREELSLPGFSSASFYLHQRAPFEIEVEAQGDAGRPSRLSVTVDDGASIAPALDLRIPPGDSRQASAPMSTMSEAFLRLELSSHGPGRVSVKALRLRSKAPDSRGGKEAQRQRPHDSARPSVVLFVADALRADHLGAYGHAADTSPRLDAFAREAICFEDAWAQSSWTRPAVASILTGLGPDAHGVDEIDTVLVEGIQTLPEALQAEGYRTGAFVGNHVVSRRLGFGQGFDTWNGDDEASVYGARPRQVVGRALDWLSATAAPFFLYVHTLDPHGPYEPPPEHWRPFLFDDYGGNRDVKALAHTRQLAPMELRFLRSAYQGEIHEADAAFGALLDGLRSRGLYDGTLILFTADHGEEFRDHGGGGHGHTLYREVTRVPLVVRLPGAVRGGTRDLHPVQQVDLFPSVVSAGGGDVPAWIEGRDLWDSWRTGEGQPPPELLFSRLRFASFDKACVRADGMKLIVNNDHRWRRLSRLELYDLESDPLERVNLVRARPIVARYLRDRLAALEASQAGLRARLRAGDTVELTAEERARLRALGYLETQQ